MVSFKSDFPGLDIAIQPILGVAWPLRLVNKFVIPWGPGGSESVDDSGKMVGVRPNIITVGLTTGDVDRDGAPCRRWWAAESRDGCKDAHDDERVGKLRT